MLYTDSKNDTPHWKRLIRIIETNSWRCTGQPKGSHCVAKNLVQMLFGLEAFPGVVPVPDHPLSSCVSSLGKKLLSVFSIAVAQKREKLMKTKQVRAQLDLSASARCMAQC